MLNVITFLLRGIVTAVIIFINFAVFLQKIALITRGRECCNECRSECLPFLNFLIEVGRNGGRQFLLSYI
jgi:hypothetical protein